MTKNDVKVRSTPIYCLDLDDRYCQIKLDDGGILFLCFVTCIQRRKHFVVNLREMAPFYQGSLGQGWLSLFCLYPKLRWLLSGLEFSFYVSSSTCHLNQVALLVWPRQNINSKLGKRKTWPVYDSLQFLGFAICTPDSHKTASPLHLTP